MIQITQTENTNIALSGYIFPIGTVFTAFLVLTEDGTKDKKSLLNCTYQWYIGEALEPTNGLNLPYGLSIDITDQLEQKFNEALLINTNLEVDQINVLFPNLNGEIKIII